MAGDKKIIAVIDGGGRGAALAHKYSLSPQVSKIIVIPGNDLISLNCKKPVKIFPHIKTTNVLEIIKICKIEKIDLIDVAQDSAIEVGLVDKLLEHGFQAVGPTKLAGQIEWDKAWARDFMKKYKLPIPLYKVFNSQKLAREYILKNPKKKWFIKASGLADGKGVMPAGNLKEALEAISQMKKFGESGKTFVIEEWLEGEEFSMFAITDGTHHKIVGCAQDHKRLLDRDLGPNTGGMGCSTPPLVVTDTIYKQGEEILKKTIQGLKKEGRTYKGILYLGAMVYKNTVKVIEFNARWGDPEAEVLVPRIINDIYELSMAVVKEKLQKTRIKHDKKNRIVAVGSLRSGIEKRRREIFGISDVMKIPGVILYGVRITREKNKFYVSSGRLFHIVAEGKNVIEARQKAYGAMAKIFIEGNSLHYRTDIGWRDVERLRKKVGAITR